jgi:archaemetzincin
MQKDICMRLFCLSILIIFLSACSDNGEQANYSKTPIPHKPEEAIICIQPIGKVDKIMLDSVKKTLAKAYPFKIEIGKEIDLPKYYKSPRGPQRYRADSIIRCLQRLDIKAHRIVGITGYEICTTKHDSTGAIKKPEYRYKDWGIFGLGFCPGRSCVVSYYYLKQRSKSLMMSRLRKITIHEVGHTLGLPHCPDKNCVMTDACEKITTIDNTKGVLCERCRKNIAYR